MGEEIMALAKEYFYFIIMGCGFLVFIGSLLNWKWMVTILSPSKFPLIRGFIEGLHGAEARYKFERFVTMFSGIILIIAGILYWHFYT